MNLYTIKIQNQNPKKLGKYDWKFFQSKRDMKRWIRNNPDLFVEIERSETNDFEKGQQGIIVTQYF